MSFRLARPAGRLLLSLRMIRFRFGKCVAIAAGAAVIAICSCEKHHVGELPEVQKEHVEAGAGSEESAAGPKERSTLSAPPSQSTSPTPGEFFPTKP